ncbi:MAG: dihydrodipicolinate synthase family protein [Xanthomonadales bacterium]|nr:dihydrodipicolinate synthase family protein [Xanthomonadales bacterium]
MNTDRWQGVYPAVTTKFKADMSLDLDAMAKHLEFQLEAGVHGVIILGSLGENPTLNMHEKLQLTEFFIKQVNGRVPLLACIAESDTRQACYFASRAEAMGIDGFMLLPPMRYPSDQSETMSYLQEVAAASDVPIMLYNNPVAYGTDLSPADFKALAINPKFVAIKESSANTRRVPEIRRRTGDRYAIFCGVDDLAYECFSLGAVGWVAGLVVAFPRETVGLYDLMCAGEWAEARQLYEWFLPLLSLDIGPKFVQQIKLVEEIVGVGSARVRSPRLALNESETRHVRQVVEQALANRPVV